MSGLTSDELTAEIMAGVPSLSEREPESWPDVERWADETPPPPKQSPTKRAPQYVDVAGVLAGEVTAPVPCYGLRTDGAALFYAGAVNNMFGAPEGAKTMALTAVVAEGLRAGGSVLWTDLDHNGAPATIARLRMFGVPVATLTDPSRFRLAEPEDAAEMRAIVSDAATWSPTIAGVDSIGELLPMFGANSNDADDYSRVNRETLAVLARGGACVIAIDHEAKGADSRAFGSTGTAAKKRAIDGAMLRVTVRDQFRPGHGGSAILTIVKDRHGGVRVNSPSGDREPIAAIFTMTADPFTATFVAPNLDVSHLETDLDLLLKLDPPPSSVRDVKERTKLGTGRASDAWRLYKESAPGGVPPFPSLRVGEHGNNTVPGTRRNVPGTPSADQEALTYRDVGDSDSGEVTS